MKEISKLLDKTSVLNSRKMRGSQTILGQITVFKQKGNEENQLSLGQNIAPAAVMGEGQEKFFQKFHF